MKTLFHILDENNNVVEAKNNQEAEEFYKSDKRTVGRDDVVTNDGSNVTVSTVFLALDHGYGTPLWFETMIFSDNENYNQKFQTRYATYDEALKSHNFIVQSIKDLS